MPHHSRGALPMTGRCIHLTTTRADPKGTAEGGVGVRGAESAKPPTHRRSQGRINHYAGCTMGAPRRQGAPDQLPHF